MRIHPGTLALLAAALLALPAHARADDQADPFVCTGGWCYDTSSSGGGYADAVPDPPIDLSPAAGSGDSAGGYASPPTDYPTTDAPPESQPATPGPGDHYDPANDPYAETITVVCSYSTGQCDNITNATVEQLDKLGILPEMLELDPTMVDSPNSPPPAGGNKDTMERFMDETLPVFDMWGLALGLYEGSVADIERAASFQETLETAQRASELAPAESWGNSQTLYDHFVAHGSDFAAEDAIDYAKQAKQALSTATDSETWGINVTENTVRIYDPETNTFGAYQEATGQTRTFFKPTEGREYWDGVTATEGEPLQDPVFKK